MISRIVRDGKVAVLHSKGYSGWYTMHGIPELLFDPKLVEMVETVHADCSDISYDIEDYCAANYPEFTEAVSWFGRDFKLAIEWVPVGTLFRIEHEQFDYTGQEAVVQMQPEDYHIA